MRPQETFDELVAIDRAADPHPRRWPLLLLALPLLAVIVPAVYNHLRPYWLGLPFFIWYQFAAVVLGGVAAGLAHLLTREHSPEGQAPEPSAPQEPNG